MAFNWNDNPWTGFFDDNPQSLYSAMLGGNNNKSNNFMNYWNSQYGNQYGNYMGKLGQQILGGGAPTMSFYDYLMQNSMGKQWASLSPGARGQMRNQSGKWNIRTY